MNESGISNVSKDSMKEFLVAVLEDNPKNERAVGLTDNDIVETYESTVEVIRFSEELNKKSTFVEVINGMLKKARNPQSSSREAKPNQVADEVAVDSPETVLRSLVPRLNETLFEALAEAPF